jgi:hypothetical protein
MGRYLADYARSYYAITRRKVCAATPTAWRACVRVPGACACVRVSGVCACVRRSVASTRRTYLLLERLRRALLRLPALRAARAREQAGWDANRHYEILMTGCARARSRTTARTCRAVSAGPCHVSGGRCVPRVGWQVCATCRVAGVCRSGRTTSTSGPSTRCDRAAHTRAHACTHTHTPTHTRTHARTRNTAGHRRPSAAVVSRSLSTLGRTVGLPRGRLYGTLGYSGVLLAGAGRTVPAGSSTRGS